MGGTSTCWMPFLAWICAFILAAAAAIGRISQCSQNMVFWRLPAAAAGSSGVFLADSEAGLPEARPTGLLLRLESECLAGGGDRDRRSKREVRFGSGSVWSKRDRFALLRSVSSIFHSCLSSVCMRVSARCAPLMFVVNSCLPFANFFRQQTQMPFPTNPRKSLA